MLICILCGKIIIMNETPVRYSVCPSCDVSKLTEAQENIIKAGKPILDLPTALKHLSIKFKDLSDAQKEELKEILLVEVDQDGK